MKKTKILQQLTSRMPKNIYQSTGIVYEGEKHLLLSISLPFVLSVLFVSGSIFVKSFHYTALPAH